MHLILSVIQPALLMVNGEDGVSGHSVLKPVEYQEEAF